MKLTRRTALLGLASAWAARGPYGRVSLALAAAPTERRLVVVLLRGALDGMAAVTPYGDRNLAGLRGGLLLPGPGQPGGLLDLGGFFGLHPALAGMWGMYREGMLLPIHAVVGPTRSRSHFEAQDSLETGTERPLTSGWLNRVIADLPTAGGMGSSGVAVGVSVPLLMRGPAPVSAYAPQGFAEPSPDLYARIAALHRADPVTGPAVAEGLRDRGFADVVLAQAPGPGLPGPAAAPHPSMRPLPPAPGMPQEGMETEMAAEGGGRQAAGAAMAGEAWQPSAFPALAAAAGRLLAAPTGPRIAALEIGGWDTHAGQLHRLDGPLRELDAGLVALRAGLGEAWGRTVVLVLTEFGRTVRMNGTLGTDHGTASVAFVAGGAVSGGRVLATWPGLAESQLYEGRDLAPTVDVRSVAKGVLQAHLGLAPAALERVFPDSARAAPLGGLLRA